MIEALGASHVEAVTQLHLQSLTGLLHDLGYRATKAYYEGAARSPGAIGFVDIEAGNVAGFVLGAANPRELRREILSRSLLPTLTGTFLGAVRNPATLRWLFSSLTRNDTLYNTQVAELIYLAVDPGSRASGVGRRLVCSFNQKMGTAGISAYELSVDEDNQAAVRFYERLGFVEVGRYRQFEIDHVRYRLELP